MSVESVIETVEQADLAVAEQAAESGTIPSPRPLPN
jgi:hypothetical protein